MTLNDLEALERASDTLIRAVGSNNASVLTTTAPFSDEQHELPIVVAIEAENIFKNAKTFLRQKI